MLIAVFIFYEQIKYDCTIIFFFIKKKSQTDYFIANWRHVALALKGGTHPKDFDKQKQEKG